MQSKKTVLFVFLCVLVAFLTIGCGQEAKETADPGNDEEPAPIEEAATYVGSDSCKTCHSDVYATFSETLHPIMVQDAKADPSVITGDFTVDGEPLSLTGVKKEDIVYTIGSKWKQRYVIRDDGKLKILPKQYYYENGTWNDYNADKWQDKDYSEACTACHNTGVNPETLEWAEDGIGCEACHGPASLHVKTGDKTKIVNPATLDANLQVDICAQCHIRGKSTVYEGREDALGFIPGMKLADVYKWATPETDNPEKPIFLEDGASKQHHQQFQDYVQSKHYEAGITCTACHDPHAAKEFGQLKQEPAELCASCHTGSLELEGSWEDYMPKRAKSAASNDIRIHTFKPGQPK